MAAYWARVRPLAAAVGVAASGSLTARRPTFNDEAPKEFVPIKCLKTEPHTHDTRKITLVGLAPASAAVVNVAVRASVAGDAVTRMYNPIAVSGDGNITLLVKRYADSKMGTHLHNLRPGDTIEVKGPNRQWGFKPGQYKEYAMIAGGTGITPLIQATDYILKNDSAKVTVVCANKSDADMLLTEELIALQKQFPGRLSVTRLAEDKVGNVTNIAILKKLLPPPSSNVMVMVCGKPPMTAALAGPKAKDFSQGELAGILKDLGYTSEQVWKM